MTRLRMCDLSPEQRDAARAQLAGGAPVVPVASIEGHDKPARSRVERRYAEHLQAVYLSGAIKGYQVQPEPIELAHDCLYFADFLVWFDGRPDEYVETKGAKRKRPFFHDDGARVKVKVAARLLAQRDPPALLVVAWRPKGMPWQREVVQA